MDPPTELVPSFLAASWPPTRRSEDQRKANAENVQRNILTCPTDVKAELSFQVLGYAQYNMTFMHRFERGFAPFCRCFEL